MSWRLTSCLLGGWAILKLAEVVRDLFTVVELAMHRAL
jgi:hypothetical protein